MITFKKLSKDIPYIILKDKYDEAIDAGQKNIEAIAISSFNQESREVDSRFVNLKFVDKKKFIFFTNYNSPKSIAFNSHNQIGALLYWQSTNTQIRMKAKITKTPYEFNQKYFEERSIHKNTLAISSNQSQIVNSYNDVIVKYEETKKTADLLKCPDYWGGYSFTPYFFEFWQGHESRLNKREAYECCNGKWKRSFLEP